MSHSQLPPASTSNYVDRLKRPSAGGFQTTDWSELGRLESPDFAAALSNLCQQYWLPVYTFIRRRVADAHLAEDLTQGFFCKVISLRTLRMADRERGRFRAYLLTSVKNYLASEYHASRAEKRGGERNVLSLDFAMADQIYQRSRSSEPTPDQAFDRAWALSLIEHAIDRLRQEYEELNEPLRFELFMPGLRSAKLDYQAIAIQLGLSEVAARKAASRFRVRYGQHLRLEIAATLADGECIESEIDWILNVLRTE